MELHKIIEGVKLACDEADLFPSQDAILDVSVRIYNTKNINKETTKDNKPTAKQINTLNKFKIKNIDKLTKEEATQIIKERIERINKDKAHQ